MLTPEDRDEIETAVIEAMKRGAEEMSQCHNIQLLVIISTAAAIYASRRGPIKAAEDLRDLADQIERRRH